MFQFKSRNPCLREAASAKAGDILILHRNYPFLPMSSICNLKSEIESGPTFLWMTPESTRFTIPY
jgi:hypothetical protein